MKIPADDLAPDLTATVPAPGAPGSILPPSFVASVDAVADHRKARTVDAIPDGARFATRDEVRAAMETAAEVAAVRSAPMVDALRGIEAAAKVQAMTNLAALALMIVGAAIVVWRLRG